MKTVVDWNEAPLVRWLGTITKKGTRHAYKSAFRAYTKFTGMTATEMIDEAIEDSKRDVREKKDIVKTRLLNFYRWLIDEYPVYSRGKGERKLIRKGVRSKSAHMFVNGIRSFYGTFEIFVKLKGRSSLPPARVINKKLDLTTMDVKALVDHARNPRDRAIILTMFQSGMDVSTLCSMLYEDVTEGLKTKELPLKLEPFREKAGVEYYTFLGRDAVKSIEAYLNDLESRGIRLKPKSPLFVKLAKRNGELQSLETHLVQKVLRESALRSGLVDKDMNGHDQNPASPHALREAFGSIMVNKGVPDSIVDFWLGHSIGEMSEAYKRQRFEEVKRMYVERERYISITAPESEAIEEVRRESEERTRQLRENFDNLYSENVDLKKTIDDLRKRLSEAEKITKPLDGGIDTLTTVINAFQGVKTAEDLMEHLFLSFSEMLGEKGEEIFMEAFKKKKA